MKTKIFKALSVVLALMIVLSTCICVVSAAEATISFADLANRVSADANQQVWTQNGITVTNDKGNSTSNVNPEYYNPVRFYKNSDVTIAYPGMTKIEIDCTGVPAKNTNAWVNSIKDATATLDGSIVTITFAAAVDSFKVTLTDNQARANSITVYTGEAGGTTPEEPETPVEPEEPEVQDPAADSTLTIVEANALGTSKASNEYTAGKYYVEGVIEAIANTTYGNMYIKDAEGNMLYIYGAYSADGQVRYDAMEVKPVAGDTVKIYGIIGNYNGTAQIKNGWVVEHTVAEGPQVSTDPAADSTLTIVEAIALGTSKLSNVYTEGKYYVVGEITEVYNTTYGNMKIKDAEGNILTIYGTYSADGSARYDVMEVKPVAGDTVKIYGIIGNYNGTAQIKDGWIVEHTPATQPEEPTVCTHAYDDDFDVFCNKCNEMREINYPADKVELKEIDGVKYIYVNGITSVEGLFKVGDDYYCATWGGVVLTGDQYVHLSYCDKAAGKHLFFAEDGKMVVKGFETVDGVKKLYIDGRTSVEGLFEVDGKYYLATWGGVVLTDGRYYVTESFAEGIDAGKEFTVDENGAVLDGIVEIDGQKYYYDFGTTVVPGEYEVGGQTVVATWGGLIVE